MTDLDVKPGTVADGVPHDLVRLVREHSRATVEGDNRTVLDDFRPDRIGQLIRMAKLPPNLVSSELLNIAPEGNGIVAAVTRYMAADGTGTVLRARWIEIPKGWVVTEVRNLPDTPPQMADTGPAEDGLDTPFWEGLRVGELRVPQCEGCENFVWPPRPICPRCHRFALTWTPVEPTGTIYSWTRTWQPFTPEFSGHLPFVTVVAELPQAGNRRLLGVLLDADGVDPKIGQGVRAEIEPPWSPEGWPVLRWRLT
ncbi:hypothetical protein MCHIJ_51170 [Mycolicibacterium chitae]|uniref:Putative nucleic-acid-binding protein containing a Zn-ribbon n=1 Tax=Mycolicibacterium chitae TaxID=1792 RepID=A0A3S4RUP7_MYCCI|nr:zinc ribbon domain-containing protein [Mycolicibacterium chitae]MCV7105040.1 OB-fold domain-containing protein [Mycolicibacterium chitae]BBZ05680.1 hypothetical protein MCHIJ_51170 [Mycolicibacterium chitae]VEG49291.1 putative nucleic-acid-binding protein containing a Zn-ribbon [Mycolicibacterium chitae]